MSLLLSPSVGAIVAKGWLQTRHSRRETRRQLRRLARYPAPPRFPFPPVQRVFNGKWLGRSH